MFCTTCGKELVRDALFCAECGNACAATPISTMPLPQLLPPSKPPTLWQSFASFTQRERNILLAIVIIPAMLLIMPSFSRLFWSNFALMNLFNISLGVLGALFFIAVLIVSAVTKKWHLLWPLLLFASLPILNTILNYIQGFWSSHLYFENPIRTISDFISNFIWAITAIVRHASIWLTVYYVGRYFSARQTQQNNAPKETPHEHPHPQ